MKNDTIRSKITVAISRVSKVFRLLPVSHISMRCVLFLLLILCQSSCVHQYVRQIKVSKGLLDLGSCEVNKQSLFKMDGEWEFYWQTFLDPKQHLNHEVETSCEYMKVPSIWNGKKIGKQQLNGYGYASYRLRIHLPSKIDIPLGIKLLNVASACEVYVNGTKIGGIGTVGSTGTDTHPAYQPQILYLPKNNSDFEVIIHVSNFR